MKHSQNPLQKLSLFIFLILSVFSSKADHLMGMEISYQCTATPGVYSITTKLYRDCSKIEICANCPTSLSPNCALSMNIVGAAAPYGSGLPYNTYTGIGFGSTNLTVVTSASGFDVVQLCNTSKTICSNCGTRTAGTFSPGVEVYTFSGQVNLSYLPASCCLVSIGFSMCCRNNAISTITNPGSQNFFSDVIINRCATPCNSSPTLAFESEIAIASGKDYILNLGATDPDGDSLSYHQGWALNAAGSSLPYVSPYSNSVPFPYLGAPSQSPPASPPFGITLDPVTGNYRFRPQGNFVAPIVIEIRQWKKIGGIPTLMGITRKEHQLYSQLTTSNNYPELVLYNQTVPQTLGLYTYSIADTICAGTAYCRSILAKDIDAADTTDITWNLPYEISSTGGTITRAFNPATRGINGPRQDSVRFCWTPPASITTNKAYYLNIIAKDRACPLNGKTLLNITLFVNESPSAIINKTLINTTTRKFTYTKTNSAVSIPSQTQWQIETSPGSNSYTTYPADSLPNYSFSSFGWYKIRLLLSGSCSTPTTIKDSVLITTFNLSLVEAKNIICKNDSSGRIVVKATGGWPPYQYQIKVGSTSSAFGSKDTFNLLAANTYTINVKDSLSNTNGSITGSLVVSLSQPQNAISLSVVSTKRPTCNGDSNGVITVGAINNTGPFQFKLGTGSFQTNAVFSNLKAGTHPISIQDSLGCRTTQNVSLNQATSINAGFDFISPVYCKGDSTGAIYITAGGGVSPLKYRLNGSPYQTFINYSAVFRDLLAGPKLIELVDSIGCVKTLTVTINEPAIKLQVSVLSKTLASCTNPIGSATLFATGGTLPYLYGKQNGPAPTSSSTFSNLPIGSYTFLVRDSNNCLATVKDTIKTVNPLNLIVNKTDVSCFGLQNGAINCSATGGLGNYLYKLDGGAYGPINMFSKVAPGSHVIYVKEPSYSDTSSCIKTAQITINQPATLVSTIISTNTACVGANTGTAEVFVSGGKAPYTYSWNSIPIQNKAKAINLPSGKVIVTITDSIACAQKDSAIIGAKTLYKDETICAVTVDSITNQNIVVWNKTPDKGTAAYQIWVAPNGIATPTLISTIPYSSTSAFIDTISTPLPASQAYYYSLISLDSCSNTSPLSFAHKPISLSSSVTGNSVTLYWIPYSGPVSISQHKVYRANNGGTYNLIATIPFGKNNYIDSLGGPGSKHYIVEGVSSPVCFPNFKILSNRVSIYASGIQEANNASNNFLIYPNPSTGKIKIIQKSQSVDMNEIVLVSVDGKELQRFVINDKSKQIELDLSMYSDGVYQLLVQTNVGNYSQKIILQH